MNVLLETWHALSWPVRLVIVVVGLAFPLSLVIPYHPTRPTTASQVTKRPNGVRQSDFRAVQLGRGNQTSYRQVVAQLGEGTLLDTSADGRTRTYQWPGGSNWARLEVTFRDSLAVEKFAFLLRNR